MRLGRPTVEGCGSIVIALGNLLKLGQGIPVFSVVYGGHLGSNPFSITVRVEFGSDYRGRLMISHAAFHHMTCPVAAAAYTVELASIPWQFGGRRWFMLCPRSGRRVLKLYLPNGAQRFASRASMGLAYQVQRLDPMQKGHARLRRAYAKLGSGYTNLHQPIPDRPKWMRFGTYDRLVAEIESAAIRHRTTFCERLARTL